MTGRATYLGEELIVSFTARGELSDYGVPGSPTWVEWVDAEIEHLQILGFDVDPKVLPSALYDAILDLADEVEFEEEDDYDEPDRSDYDWERKQRQEGGGS